MTELEDIRQRVCSQLSLIIMDAACLVHEHAAAESTLQASKMKTVFGVASEALAARQGVRFDKVCGPGRLKIGT